LSFPGHGDRENLQNAEILDFDSKLTGLFTSEDLIISSCHKCLTS